MLSASHSLLILLVISCFFQGMSVRWQRNWFEFGPHIQHRKGVNLKSNSHMEAYIDACIKLLYFHTVNTSSKIKQQKLTVKLCFKATYLACKFTTRISWNKDTIFILLKSIVRPIRQVKSKCLHMLWVLRVLYSGGGSGMHGNHTFAPRILLSLQSNYKFRVTHSSVSLLSKFVVLQVFIPTKKLSQKRTLPSVCSLTVLLLAVVTTSSCSCTPSEFLKGCL